MPVCEFCTKEVKWTASTSFHGHYCEECIKLALDDERKALQEIAKKKREQKSNGGEGE